VHGDLAAIDLRTASRTHCRLPATGYRMHITVAGIWMSWLFLHDFILITQWICLKKKEKLPVQHRYSEIGTVD
jgi:hypothetical protein